MSNGFSDVTPDKWYYRDIIELSSLILDEDIPFVLGYPYNTFETGQEAVDELIISQTSESIVTSTHALVHTDVNPLSIWVDGVLASFVTLEEGSVAGTTVITLKRTVRPGSLIRIFQAGIPEVDVNNRNQPVGVGFPWEFPSVVLPITSGRTYVYDPFSSVGFERVIYRGSQLERVNYDVSILTDYNFFTSDDQYTVGPDGTAYFPFDLMNEFVEMGFLEKDDTTGIHHLGYVNGVGATPTIDPTKRKVYFGFFPDVIISRAQAITIMNNMRLHYLRRLSDSDPYRESVSSVSRFTDINTFLQNTDPDPWWWQHLRDMESLKMSDGSYMVNGYPDGNFYLDNTLTRAQMVTLIDLMRQWMVDALK